jgi:hypothetical protein
MKAGLTTSDPDKVAQVVLRLVDLDEVPERLLLGGDAVVVAAAFEKARAESDAKWLDLSTSTNRDEVTAEELDPTARL